MTTNSNETSRPVSCTLAKAASYALVEISENISENIFNLYKLDEFEEISLLYQLEQHKFTTKLCRSCDGCLDYELLATNLSRLIDNFIIQYEKHFPLLKKIEERYSVSYEENNNYIKLILFVITKLKTIKDITDSEVKEILLLKEKIEGAYYNFCSSYLSHRRAAFQDIVMHLAVINKQQKFGHSEINTKDKTSVYFDQNMIGHYIDNNKFKKKISKLKDHGYIFVYSSYIIEDAIKMQRFYMKEFLENLKELTDNKIIIMNNECLSIKQEDIQYPLDRVNLFRPYTIAAEKEMIYRTRSYSVEYPVFSTKGKYYSSINKNLPDFIASIPDLVKQDSQLKKSINRMLAFHCTHLNSNSSGTLSVSLEYKSENEKINLIHDLTTMLNIFNYQTENPKDHKKIMSSLQDIEHLKYASIVNYFITEDERLRERAKFIYRALNINTIVMSCDDFERYSNEILKSKQK